MRSVLSTEEISACGGKFDKFKTGDIVRLLMYGLHENVDRVKRRLMDDLNESCARLGDSLIDSRIVDDRF